MEVEAAAQEAGTVGGCEHIAACAVLTEQALRPAAALIYTVPALYRNRQNIDLQKGYKKAFTQYSKRIFLTMSSPLSLLLQLDGFDHQLLLEVLLGDGAVSAGREL